MYIAIEFVCLCFLHWALPHMASNKEKAFGEIRSLTTRAWGGQEQMDEARTQKGVKNCDSGWPAHKASPDPYWLPNNLVLQVQRDTR